MKALLNLVPALALAATVSLAHAQTTPPAVAQEEGRMPMKNKRMEPRGMESGVLMHGGQLMQLQDGKMMPMTSEMTMSNGTKVTTTGQVTMADGKTMMLKDGQGVSMGGQLTHHGGKMKGKMAGSKMAGSM